MSQFQLNPISILDNSPMGGFRGGMADRRGLMHSDSNLLTEGLQQEKMGLENETTLLNRPLDAVTRARKIQEEELRQKLLSDGTTESGERADVDLKIAQAVSKMNDNEKQRIELQSDAIVRSAEFLKDKGEAFAAANWEEIAADMHRAGIKTFPKTYSYPAYQKLQAAHQAAWRTKKVLGDEHLNTQQHTNKLAEIEQLGVQNRITRNVGAVNDLNVVEQKLASAEEIARLRREADITRAALAAANRPRKIGQSVEDAEESVAAAFRSGDWSKISLYDIARVEMEYLEKHQKTFDANIINKLRALEAKAAAAKNPADRAKIMQELNDEKRKAMGDVFDKLEEARKNVMAAKGGSPEKNPYADVKIGDLWEGKKVTRLGWKGNKRVIQLEDGTVIEK